MRQIADRFRRPLILVVGLIGYIVAMPLVNAMAQSVLSPAITVHGVNSDDVPLERRVVVRGPQPATSLGTTPGPSATPSPLDTTLRYVGITSPEGNTLSPEKITVVWIGTPAARKPIPAILPPGNQLPSVDHLTPGQLREFELFFSLRGVVPGLYTG